MIFIPFFSESLSVLAFGEAMCGIPWGVFQVSLEGVRHDEVSNLANRY